MMIFAAQITGSSDVVSIDAETKPEAWERVVAQFGDDRGVTLYYDVDGRVAYDSHGPGGAEGYAGPRGDFSGLDEGVLLALGLV